MVLGLAGTTQGAISVSINDEAALNVPVQTQQIVGIGIQNEDGSISFIYIGQTEISHPQIYAFSNSTQLFPDTTTVLGLMLIGLQVRCRKACAVWQYNR